MRPTHERRGHLTNVALAQGVEAIEELAGTSRPFAPSDHRLDVWLHTPWGEHSGGVLFVVNPTDRPRVTRLAAPEGKLVLLKDCFSSETFGGRGELSVGLDAYSVRMFQVGS